jgi:hypothetical protein
MPRQGIELLDGHLAYGTSWCRVRVPDGSEERIGLDLCIHSAIGVGTRVFNGVTPDSGGVLLVPITRERVGYVLAIRYELLRLSSNHPQLQIAELDNHTAFKELANELTERVSRTNAPETSDIVGLIESCR